MAKRMKLTSKPASTDPRRQGSFMEVLELQRECAYVRMATICAFCGGSPSGFPPVPPTASTARRVPFEGSISTGMPFSTASWVGKGRAGRHAGFESARRGASASFRIDDDVI
ncbi:hypothetical protein ETB97_010331 [Aspergillus alliaceus]|uniref:Uncharacterized protein n=1 Tax=Petromyces alliaceus TaxID=209559 RepID=A0A8H6AA49_PETAA|nr:hypothetical protein ETB97_010331 [Aspergillus burnettii]